MPRLDEALIRKKAEHHDGLLSDLEELSLHQLELERIEVVGTLCRKLRILYLQNNIISRLENLQHLKEMRYLNMALNNLVRVEGLSSCEFLGKLDFTVNFIDVDELESSIEHLSSLLHLHDLYLMGNPCLSWAGARPYIVAVLPQLQQLDGKEITRSERIEAVQRYKTLRAELRVLAEDKRREKEAVISTTSSSNSSSSSKTREDEGGGSKASKEAGGDEDDDSDSEPWSPEARTKMYRELAESKAEKEEKRRDKAAKPRDELGEQRQRIADVREREAGGAVRQCNEGRWAFKLDEAEETVAPVSGGGAPTSTSERSSCIRLSLALSPFLDLSLIDVDIHPQYLSVVIKGKVFRLSLPEEVLPSRSKIQRSTTTGELLILMPKALQRSYSSISSTSTSSSSSSLRRNIIESDASASKTPAAHAANTLVGSTLSSSNSSSSSSSSGVRTTILKKHTNLGDELLAAAAAASLSTSLSNIVVDKTKSQQSSSSSLIQLGGLESTRKKPLIITTSAVDADGNDVMQSERRDTPGSGAKVMIGRGGSGGGDHAARDQRAAGDDNGDDGDVPPLI